MSKRLLEEKQEEMADRKLAAALGISYSELCELDYEIDENTSSDGLIYNYIVTFSSSCPSTILSKISGINDNTVLLDPNALD